jgi:hypothetical protein
MTRSDQRNTTEALHDLLPGRFTGVDELPASPWSEMQTATVEMSCTAELGGALIVMRVAEKRTAGTFEAVNVFMTDQDTGEVLLYGFDTLGYPPDPPARGQFDNDELTLHRSTARGGSRTTFASRPNGLCWSKDFRPSPDAPWQRVVTGIWRRTAGL